MNNYELLKLLTGLGSFPGLHPGLLHSGIPILDWVLIGSDMDGYKSEHVLCEFYEVLGVSLGSYHLAKDDASTSTQRGYELV